MLSPEQEARLRALLKTDKTLTEISSEMGMSYHTLRIQLGESGLRLEITRNLIDVAAEQRERSISRQFDEFARQREAEELRSLPPGTKVYGRDESGRKFYTLAPDGCDGQRYYEGDEVAAVAVAATPEPVAAG